MKTLDEVIERLEHPSRAVFERDGMLIIQEDDLANALHYLMEYRTTQTAYIKAMADIEENPPLTWDELRQMVGKPVWVEVYDPIDEKSGWHTTFWSLIEFINDEYICLRDNDGEQQCYQKKSTEWQAYRKETNV